MAPVLGTVEETVVVRPAYTENTVIPAQYKTVTEKVQTAAARVVWRKVDCKEKSDRMRGV